MVRRGRAHKKIQRMHSLKNKLIQAGCSFNWEEKTIFAAWDTPLEEELREFKKEYKFIVQYEIR
jgi:hypothetical protein